MVSIFLNRSSHNHISGNTISHTIDPYKYEKYQEPAIALNDSTNNLIYHNLLINNWVHASNNDPAANNWYHPELLEGNYWDDYPGTDTDGDGIEDTDLPWPNPDFDAYPWICEGPVVSFTYSPETPTVEDTISFIDTSTGLDGVITSWV